MNTFFERLCPSCRSNQYPYHSFPALMNGLKTKLVANGKTKWGEQWIRMKLWEMKTSSLLKPTEYLLQNMVMIVSPGRRYLTGAWKIDLKMERITHMLQVWAPQSTRANIKWVEELILSDSEFVFVMTIQKWSW